MNPYRAINRLLDMWACNTPPLQDFSVTNVLNAVRLDRTYYLSVLEFLLSKNGHELIAKKMMLCPRCSSKGEAIPFAEPIDEEQYFDCEVCGAEYHFDEDLAIVVFDFSDDFRQEELHEKKNSEHECVLC